MRSIKNKFAFPLEIKLTNRRASIGFRIQNGKVMVHAPKSISAGELERIISSRAERLEKKMSNFLKTSLKKDQIYFLGKKVSINEETVFNGNVISLPVDLSQQNLLQQWYGIQAHNIITPRVKEISKRTALFPVKVEFKFFKSIWGNCNRNKVVKLNILLVMCPLEVIDYVIIHEFCHLKEMNHSAKFWQLVGYHCPNYKKSIKFLKESQLITRFLS